MLGNPYIDWFKIGPGNKFSRNYFYIDIKTKHREIPKPNQFPAGSEPNTKRISAFLKNFNRNTSNSRYMGEHLPAFVCGLFNSA